MNKSKKNSIIEKVNNDVIDEEVKKVFDLKIIFKSIALIITLIILIISFLNNQRIYLFTHMFGSFLLNIDFLAITLYYLSLILITIYNLSYIILAYVYKEKSYRIMLKYDKIFDMPYFIFKTISLLFFVFIFLFSPCSIVGNSMAPTLKNNERVICYGLFYTPEQNDIVVLNAKYVNNGVDIFYVKRVVAVNGDIISYDSASELLYVNYKMVEKITLEQYENILNSIDMNYEDSFVVPKNKAMVLGDNRDISLDSREFGLVNYDDIFGKVIFRISPFDTF